jgi:hypothetical protein
MTVSRFTVVSAPFEDHLAERASRWSSVHGDANTTFLARARCASHAASQPGRLPFALAVTILALVAVRTLVVWRETRRLVSNHTLAAPLEGACDAPDAPSHAHRD